MSAEHFDLDRDNEPEDDHSGPHEIDWLALRKKQRAWYMRLTGRYSGVQGLSQIVYHDPYPEPGE